MQGQERGRGLVICSTWPTLECSLPVNSPPISSESSTTQLQSPLSRSGVIEPRRASDGLVVIFCESWPVWLFVLPGLRLQCFEVMISTPEPPWLPLLCSAYPRVQFQVNLCQSTFQADIDPEAWLLLHGSASWAHQLPPSVWLTRRALLSYSPGGSDTAADCYISSRTAGSVVDGIWSFRFPPNAPVVPSPTMYLRNPRHIIDPTTWLAGWSKITKVPLLCTAALPLLCLHQPVRCRSVFRPGGWLVRPLSCVELGRAFDLPPWLCSLFAGESFSPSTLPWLSSPPLKVLHHIGHYVR
jgi:hypothetical protein